MLPFFFFFFIFFLVNYSGDEQPPTPYYNWACAVDVAMQQQQQLIMDCLGNKTNLTQGIQLIKIWLAQRDLDKVSAGGQFSSPKILEVSYQISIRLANSNFRIFSLYVLMTACTFQWT